MLRVAVLAALSISLALFAQKAPKQTDVRVQRTSITRDQEFQIGKEAASAVEREMEVVQNPEIERWLNQIGQRLAKAPEANAYPYYFRVVNEPSINAFALPGGPMYVHTGLLGQPHRERSGESSSKCLTWRCGMVRRRLANSKLGRVVRLAGVAQMGAVTTDARTVRTALSARRVGAGIGGSSVLMKFSRGFGAMPIERRTRWHHPAMTDPAADVLRSSRRKWAPPPSRKDSRCGCPRTQPAAASVRLAGHKVHRARLLGRYRYFPRVKNCADFRRLNQTCIPSPG